MTDILAPLVSLLFVVSFLLGFAALILIDLALAKMNETHCDSRWLGHRLKRGK